VFTLWRKWTAGRDSEWIIAEPEISGLAAGKTAPEVAAAPPAEKAALCDGRHFAGRRAALTLNQADAAVSEKGSRP